MRPLPDVPAEDVLFWTRWYVESLEPTAFVPLLDQRLVLTASYGSRDVLDSILRPEAFIYGRPEAQHSLHVDLDCLLHRYDVGELSLLVYEQQRYVTVRVAAVTRPGEVADAFVRRVMGALLRFTPTWYFFPTSAQGEFVRFSTEAGYTSELSGMALGISGAVVPGGLYFTRFRWRDDDLSGRPPHTTPLLDDDLRAHWAKVRGTATP